MRTKRSRARRLPSWSFLRRFRLRILFQNVPNYIVLVFGVIFIELMMCFAFGLPDSLDSYGQKAPDMMFVDYQYMLMSGKDSDGEVIETSEETAERFSAKTLMYPRDTGVVLRGFGSGKDESVTVFAVVGFGVGFCLMLWIFKVFILQMDGYFTFYMKPVSMVLCVVYLFVGYFLVSVVDYIRIKRIPMDEALKNLE